MSNEIDDPQRLLFDERAITTVLHDYARALDARDWPLLESLFTPDAVVDYSSEGGPVCHGRAAVVADCKDDFTGLDATSHLIGNIAMAVDRDGARVSSLVHAWHFRAGADRRIDAAVGRRLRRPARPHAERLANRRAHADGRLSDRQLGGQGAQTGPWAVKNPADAPPSTT